MTAFHIESPTFLKKKFKLSFMNLHVQDIFEPHGRYPSIIQVGTEFLGPTDNTFFKMVGFGMGPYIGHIHWDYPLLAALLDRWDAHTLTFHLPTREMMITVEEIH